MPKQKRITDPIHGSIFITPLEADIVSSKSFQRLHNIRQLGLAHLIFPGANYSRFSHSLGACHNASRMLYSAQQNTTRKSGQINDLEKALRLGALLHDIGHYPFSHATEHVIQNFYSKHKLQPVGPISQTNSPTPKGNGINHEALGRKVLEHDPELAQIFERHDVDVEAVKTIFSKESPENSLVEMISSDLDCDRLDYLKRTAHHTGLPYGGVDTDFLASQARVDNEFRFCFSSRAIRAADHLLISRYYDYLQVPYNKTVCSLEWSLTTCIEMLLENGLDCSSDEMIRKIETGAWHLFDDNYFFSQFRTLLDRAKESDNAVLTDHLHAILERKPATTLIAYEALIPSADAKTFPTYKSKLEELISKFSTAESIDNNRLKVWDTKLNFAKYTVEDAENDCDVGAVRIVDETGHSKPLCLYNDSLFGKLIDQQHRGLRVFYLDDGKLFGNNIKAKLTKYLNANFEWPPCVETKN